MSQRYKIRLEDRWRVKAVGSDRVTVELEFLPLMERSRLSELLASELVRRAFAESANGTWEKQIGEHRLSIESATGTATLSGEFSQVVEASGAVEGTLDECGETRDLAEAELRRVLEEQLAESVDAATDEHRTALVDELGRQLQMLEPELNQIVDAVTIDALKEKARQLGNIESIDEDRESGSLSLVIEL